MAAEGEFLAISLLQAWGRNLVCQCLPTTANLIGGKKGYYLSKSRKEQKEEDKDGQAVT